MYDNLYFETVKLILDSAITRYCQTNGLEVRQVDQEIVAQICDTANQHRNPDPDIDYRNPLCRLGTFLFMQVSMLHSLSKQYCKVLYYRICLRVGPMTRYQSAQ